LVPTKELAHYRCVRTPQQNHPCLAQAVGQLLAHRGLHRLGFALGCDQCYGTRRDSGALRSLRALRTITTRAYCACPLLVSRPIWSGSLNPASKEYVQNFGLSSIREGEDGRDKSQTTGSRPSIGLSMSRNSFSTWREEGAHSRSRLLDEASGALAIANGVAPSSTRRRSWVTTSSGVSSLRAGGSGAAYSAGALAI